MRNFSRCLALFACAVGLAGCGEPAARQGIQSSDPGKRILAIRAAGDSKDRAAVPLLVDRLNDEDAAVRFYSILALERITGTRMGYDYGAPRSARSESIERWREAMNSGEFAQTTSRPADEVSRIATDGNGVRRTE